VQAIASEDSVNEAFGMPLIAGISRVLFSWAELDVPEEVELTLTPQVLSVSQSKH